MTTSVNLSVPICLMGLKCYCFYSDNEVNASHYGRELSCGVASGPHQPPSPFPILTSQVDSGRGPPGCHLPGFLGRPGPGPIPTLPTGRAGTLPAWSCSRDRDTATSSVPPSRDALTTGPDARMKEGRKARRAGRGQRGVSRGRVHAYARAARLLGGDCGSGPLNASPPLPARQAPTPDTPRSPHSGLRTPSRRRSPKSRGAGGGKPMAGTSPGPPDRTAPASEAGKRPEAAQRPLSPLRRHLVKRTPGAMATTNRPPACGASRRDWTGGREPASGPASASRPRPQHPGPAHKPCAHLKDQVPTQT